MPSLKRVSEASDDHEEDMVGQTRMVTDPLLVVLLRITHNGRHANYLVLARLRTPRDRAHPESIPQNCGAKGLHVWRPPTKRSGLLFSPPEITFIFTSLRA